MAFMMQQKAYEPAALAIISFGLTWLSMAIIQLVGRGGAQAQMAAGH
jgi:putative spermidine/putrescine transport system permease protein